LNGTITWQGEDPSDTGIIRIDDNVIEVEEASKDA
jgi:hypothetical protein